MTFQHQSLAEGRWYNLSLAEQLANIGSEVSRAIKAKHDKTRFENAICRALELFYLTINDPRWIGRLKELTRTREVLCDIVYGDNQFGTSLEDLDRYFYYFAYSARINK